MKSVLIPSDWPLVGRQIGDGPVLRFALFMFDCHYPGGGWADFVGSFDTIEDAVAGAKAARPCDNRTIIDLQTGEDVTPCEIA